MKKIKITRGKLVIWLFWVCFLVLRLPSLFEPDWYGDEGIYLTLGMGLRKGMALYSQIHDNKPPLIYWMAALTGSVFWFRMVLLGWMAGTCYFFWRFLAGNFKRRLANLLGFGFMVLTSIPLIEGNIANAEIFMLLFTVLALRQIWPLEALSNTKVFLAGIWLGLSFLTKTPAIITAAAFGFLIVTYEKKKWLDKIKWALLFGFGFFGPLVLTLPYFYSQGSLGLYIHAAWMQNVGYLSSWSTGSHNAGMQSGLMVRMGLLTVMWLVLWWQKKRWPPLLWFGVVWWLAELFAAALSERPYPHYLISLLLPLALLVGKWLEKGDIRVEIISLTCGLGFLWVLVTHFNFYFYPVLTYYSSFYLHHDNWQPFFGSQAAEDKTIAKLVAENSQNDAAIFVWADRPFVYTLSNRLPVSRFIVAYHVADFGTHDEVMAAIINKKPEIIVWETNNQRPFEKLVKHLERYYFPIYSLDKGKVLIFKNKHV